MPLYDYKCEECSYVEEKLEFGDEIDKDHFCPKCNGKMIRLPPTKMSFELKYDNKKDVCGWGFNNYETSRYWDDVNKERAKGKDVKPAT